jgi:hypothetical protein
MRLYGLPEHLIILGSGYIGAEFAHVFSAFGSQVSIIGRSGRLLRSQDDAERLEDTIRPAVTGDSAGVELVPDPGRTRGSATTTKLRWGSARTTVIRKSIWVMAG